MGCYGTPINGRPNIHGFTIGADFNLGREPIFTRRFRYLKWRNPHLAVWIAAYVKDVSHPQNSRRLRFGIPAFLVPETFGENCSYKWLYSKPRFTTETKTRIKISKVCVSPSKKQGETLWPRQVQVVVVATMAATMVGTAVGVARVAAVMVAGVDALEAWKGASDALEDHPT